jgi:transcriptional regulator with XRE-family HTH domain
MIQLEFTPEAIAALHHKRYHHPHPRVQRKMDVLLLKSNGLSHKQIASITRVSVNTVTSYVRTYHQGGIDQLKQVHLNLGIPITLVLDNALHQKCALVIDLDKYLIERLWKFMKKKCLYSKYYEDFSHLNLQ